MQDRITPGGWGEGVEVPESSGKAVSEKREISKSLGRRQIVHAKWNGWRVILTHICQLFIIEHLPKPSI